MCWHAAAENCLSAIEARQNAKSDARAPEQSAGHACMANQLEHLQLGAHGDRSSARSRCKETVCIAAMIEWHLMI